MASKIGPISIAAGSIWIPILIIGVVFVPYMARPIRGEVLALREKEFVEAAIAQGAGSLRVMFGELLPNLWSMIIVFFTLNIANNMLVESALSFLGVGVQPPDASWGTMICNGQQPDHQRTPTDDHPRNDDPAYSALAQCRLATAFATRSTRSPKCDLRRTPAWPSQREQLSDGPLRDQAARSG